MKEKNCYSCKYYEDESALESEAGCKLAFRLDLNSVACGEISKQDLIDIGLTKETNENWECRWKNKKNNPHKKMNKQ